MKKLAFLVLAMGLLAAPMAGQDVVMDSIAVTAVGRPVGLSITDWPESRMAYVGDTITFGYEAIDLDGLPTLARIDLRFAPIGAVDVLYADNDSATIVLKKKGSIKVYFTVTPVTSLRVGFIVDDAWMWDHTDIRSGADRQACAVYMHNEVPIMASSLECWTEVGVWWNLARTQE